MNTALNAESGFAGVTRYQHSREQGGVGVGVGAAGGTAQYLPPVLKWSLGGDPQQLPPQMII
jgi:hypothetical protein